MDFKVVFTETFCCDLEDILEHIAAHDPMAARKLGDRVIDMCEVLSFFPERLSESAPSARHPASCGREILQSLLSHQAE